VPSIICFHIKQHHISRDQGQNCLTGRQIFVKYTVKSSTFCKLNIVMYLNLVHCTPSLGAYPGGNVLCLCFTDPASWSYLWESQEAQWSINGLNFISGTRCYTPSSIFHLTQAQDCVPLQFLELRILKLRDGGNKTFT